MARLPYLDQADLDVEDRDLLKRPINLHRAMVNSPKGRRAWAPIGHYIRNVTALDGRLREMAILQVAYLARAPYAWSHHIAIGFQFGVSEDDIRAIIAETEGKPTALEPHARLVLAAARQMTTSLTISDEIFAALRTHLSNELLMDLVMVIAHYNATARVLATLQVDVEDAYLPYLDKFPLPAG